MPKLNLHCPCGEHLRGADEEDLVAIAMQHLRDEHPERADHYTRSDILFMAN